MYRFRLKIFSDVAKRSQYFEYVHMKMVYNDNTDPDEI